MLSPWTAQPETRQRPRQKIRYTRLLGYVHLSAFAVVNGSSLSGYRASAPLIRATSAHISATSAQAETNTSFYCYYVIMLEECMYVGTRSILQDFGKKGL